MHLESHLVDVLANGFFPEGDSCFLDIKIVMELRYLLRLAFLKDDVSYHNGTLDQVLNFSLCLRQ